MAYRNPSRKRREEGKMAQWVEMATTGAPLLGVPKYDRKQLLETQNCRMMLAEFCKRPTEQSGSRWGTATLFEGVFLNEKDSLFYSNMKISRLTPKAMVAFIERHLPKLCLNLLMAHSIDEMTVAERNGEPRLMLTLKVNQVSGQQIKWVDVTSKREHHYRLLEKSEEILANCLEDIEAFYTHKNVCEKSLQTFGQSGGLWDGTCLSVFKCDDSDDAGEDKPTWLALLRSRVEAILDQLIGCIQNRELGQDFGAEFLEFGRQWSQYSAEQFRKNVRPHYRMHKFNNDKFHSDSDQRIPVTVFDRPESYSFHTPELFNKLMGWLRPTEASVVELAVARAALGGYTDITPGISTNGSPCSLKDWRYFILLDGEPHIGKSTFLNYIESGFQYHGLKSSLLPNRITAGFGMGAFAANAVFKDDMAAKDFAALSNEGVVKSAVSGALIQMEQKGKDALEGEAMGVLFCGVNGLDPYEASKVDPGIASRCLHIKTKARVDDASLEGTETSRNSWELAQATMDAIRANPEYASWSPEMVLGSYIISCSIQRNLCHLGMVGETTLSRAIESLRKGLVSDLSRDTCVQTLAKGAAQFAAYAAKFLELTGRISTTQLGNLMGRYLAGKGEFSIPQIGTPLMIASAWSRTGRATEMAQELPLMSKLFPVVASGDFGGTSESSTLAKSGVNLKVMTGDLERLPPTEKLLERIVGSISTVDYMPRQLGRIAPIFQDAMRSVKSAFDKLANVSPGEFNAQFKKLLDSTVKVAAPANFYEAVALAFVGLD